MAFRRFKHLVFRESVTIHPVWIRAFYVIYKKPCQVRLAYHNEATRTAEYEAIPIKIKAAIDRNFDSKI